MSKRAELRAAWSKRECDMEYHFDKRAADGHLLHSLLTHGMGFCVLRDGESFTHPPTGAEALRRFRETLEARGYDPDTFTVSVRRKRGGA